MTDTGFGFSDSVEDIEESLLKKNGSRGFSSDDSEKGKFVKPRSNVFKESGKGGLYYQSQLRFYVIIIQLGAILSVVLFLICLFGFFIPIKIPMDVNIVYVSFYFFLGLLVCFVFLAASGVLGLLSVKLAFNSTIKILTTLEMIEVECFYYLFCLKLKRKSEFVRFSEIKEIRNEKEKISIGGKIKSTSYVVFVKVVGKDVKVPTPLLNSQATKVLKELNYYCKQGNTFI